MGHEQLDEHLALARRVQAIAAQGLAYADDPYDRVRYTDLGGVADRMFALLSGDHPAAATDLDLEGYATPKVDVRGAAFDERGRVLLVRERVDGGWTLPGGWAEVGRSPAQAVADEFAQEAGFAVHVVSLAALWDRRMHRQGPHRYHIYKLAFLCDITGAVAHDDLETDGVDWFPLDALPSLSIGRTTEGQLAVLAAHHADRSLPTAFD